MNAEIMRLTAQLEAERETHAASPRWQRSDEIKPAIKQRVIGLEIDSDDDEHMSAAVYRYDGEDWKNESNHSWRGRGPSLWTPIPRVSP